MYLYVFVCLESHYECGLLFFQALVGLIPDCELNTLRMVVPIILLLPWFIFTGTLPVIERSHWIPAGVYSISHGVSTLTLYSAVNYIPVGTARALFYTGKMICNVILFCGIKREKASVSKICSVLICIVGSILMIQPPPIFSGEMSTLKPDYISKGNPDTQVSDELFSANISNSSDYTVTGTCNKALANKNISCTSDDMIIPVDDYVSSLKGNSKSDILLTYGNACIGIGLSLVASVCAGAQAYARRTTGLKEVDTAPLTWWTYVIGATPSVVCMFIAGHLHFPTDTNSLLLISGHIITAFMTKLLGIFSGARASGVILTIIQYSGLVFLLLAQYTILKDINPGHR